jgi:hypothetical protein
MPQYNEYKCPACALFISCDLDPDEMLNCPLCGYHSPQLVKAVECKSLCSECIERAHKKLDEELERGIEAAFDEAGL